MVYHWVPFGIILLVKDKYINTVIVALSSFFVHFRSSQSPGSGLEKIENRQIHGYMVSLASINIFKEVVEYQSARNRSN